MQLRMTRAAWCVCVSQVLLQDCGSDIYVNCARPLYLAAQPAHWACHWRL